MLDGFCAGQVFSHRDAPPEWKIAKPINTGFYPTEFDGLLTPDRVIYKRTFLSLDGKIALYTTDGNSEHIIDCRDWVVPSKESYKQKAPVYLFEEV